VAIGPKLSEQICAVGIIALLSIVAAAVFFLIPFLPE
jgi:hypothetical protein